MPRAASVRQRILQNRPQQGGGQVARKRRPRTNAQSRIIAKEKQRQALELRKGGATYAAIAQAVGYNDASAARKAIEKAIEATIQEPAVELKTLNIERLNHMLLTLWPKVQQGDERAIDTSLRVLDKLDRLMGTEAAQQVDVNVHQQNAILVIDGSKEDYLRSLRQMAGLQGDGTNAAPSMNALGPAAAPPTGMPNTIVEGEIVPETMREVAAFMDPEDYTPEMQGWESDSASGPEPEQIPYVQDKKQWNFGVDPKPRER